ncbi:hypothetical protein GRF59_14885 [Paenibacillus sp. HJL G12]|uniref:MADF domain-containing protein n=1 Tax=Paenibacillus dendrobii TaxID=2691084 RepID=A0A7X3IJL6_9BACL|nr:hypothetical protein [Paenibacillus dendrobii]MWV44905.1 hypothetical protein [Paenibacillus dendrobii]
MTRQDGWTIEDDICLTTTVLNCISNGNTQLQAFEMVAEKTNRTAAACGFRWNSNLRNQFENEIKEAKLKKRSHTQKPSHMHGKVSGTLSTYDQPDTPFDNIIRSLQAFKEQFDEMRMTILNLQNRNSELEQQLASKPSVEVNEDMKNLLEIIKRAEKLGLTNKEKPAI